MSIFKVFLIGLGSIAAFAVLVLGVSAILFSPEYVLRVLGNGNSKITDYKIFSSNTIAKSSKPYHYDYVIDDSIGNRTIGYTKAGKQYTGTIDDIMNSSLTTSFLVIRNDKVEYEKYYNGYDKDSIETSFSTAKSIDSLMIGMAVEDGLIKSEDECITDFIPEFKDTDFEKITIRDLLTMRSNIKYEEGLLWFSDDAKVYFTPDLRDLALHHMTIDKNYAGKFHYNNYHPLLLGIILERCTGQSVSSYFQRKIWDKIGAQYDASWSVDSEKTRFEKMESGLNFKSIDFAKIGSMLLHRGQWNGQRIINEDWLKKSVIASDYLAQEDISSDFLKKKNFGYQYMWYSIDNSKGGKDFFALGKFGQYLYISPENNAVIIRTGKDDGLIGWWCVLKQIAANQT